MAKITISTDDNLVLYEYEVRPEDLIYEEWGNTCVTIKLAIREAHVKEGDRPDYSGAKRIWNR